MSNITFEIPTYNTKRIKAWTPLRDIFEPGSAQLENVAITIQSLYLYQNILQAAKLPKEFDASLCRTILIMSNSVYEASVIAVAKNIQHHCRHCKHRCQAHSTTLFDKSDSKYKSEFSLARQFLQNKVNILVFTEKSTKFFNEFKNGRNDIHLGGDIVITNNKAFSRTNVELCFSAMKGAIEFIHKGYVNHCNEFKCGR